MPEQWYWKHRGDLLGPLDTEVLERLIRQRRVADRDQIRLATSVEWLSGAEVKALFAGRERAGTSEAAAALLQKSLHPQVVEGDAEAGDTVISDAATGLRFAVRNALRTIGGVGGPVGALVSTITTGVLEGGLRVGKLLMNRGVILGIVAVVFNVVVFVQHRQGSDARNRAVLADLTAAWDRWQSLSKATSDERTAYRVDVLPKWEATLSSLMSDSQRESMPSANPLASSDRQRSIAAARRSLIQAIQEFRKIVATLEDEDGETAAPSTEDFEKHLNLARQVMDNNYQFYQPKWQPQQSQRFQSEVAATMDPWIAAAPILDVGLVLVGGWTWLRWPST